jgi:hypothetical protein
MLVSRRRFAKIIGKSHTYVNQKVDDGTITLYAGKIKVDEAIQALKDNEDPTRDAQREANERRRRDAGTLPLDREPEYKTMADMTEEEKREFKKEQEEVQKLREKIKARGGDDTADSVSREKIPKKLNDVKLFKEFYQGKLAQLDFQVKSGKYVLKEDVEKEAFEIGRQVRDAVMNVPDRISAIIATIDDEIQIMELLKEELSYALSGLEK